MINLLSNGRKSRINAARANIIIVRYLSIIILAFVFITGTLFVSHSVLSSTMASADSIIESNDTKADIYSDTKQQVELLGSQLTDARNILDQEIRYSKVLIKLGQLMPEGTVLDQLTLDAIAFSGQPVPIKAYANSAAQASLIQAQFQGSSLFSQVTLQATETTGGLPGYPIVVSMNVIFNKAGV